MKMIYKRRSALSALLVCLLCLSVSLCGCSMDAGQTAAAPHKITFFAMDTAMTLTAYDPAGSTQNAGSDQSAKTADTDDILASAKDLTVSLEKLLSVNVENSDIYAINHSNGAETFVDAETATMINSALELCKKTGGALDISVYPVIRAWGFTTGSYRVPDAGQTPGYILVPDQ